MKWVFSKKQKAKHLPSSLSLHFSFPFYQFATNEAIQRTEAYEYAQSLGSQPCLLHNFQVGFFLLLIKMYPSD